MLKEAKEFDRKF